MPTVNLTAKFIDSRKTPQKRTEYFDDDVPGLCLRITETGHKSWGLYYRFAGRQQRLSLGNYVAVSLKDARTKAKDALHDVEHGINPFTAKIENRSAEMFKTLAGRYRDEYAVKKRSYKEMARIIDRLLIPNFGAMRAKEITRKDVKELVGEIAKHAPIMANRTLDLLRRIFKWGIEEDIVAASPCYPIRKPGEEHARSRTLTEDEIKKVWAVLDQAATGTKAQRRLRLQTAASLKLRLVTAQRGGEVMSMEWSEISGDWWTIPEEKSKNGLEHRVPMSPLALRIISQIKSLGENKPSKYVFPSPKGDGHIENVQKAIQRLKQTTGIQFVGHDLRRTAASMMTGMGIPRLTVGKILNHVEPGVTAVYDRHSYDKEKREALEAWSKRLMLMVSELKEVKSET
jgi:integrase